MRLNVFAFNSLKKYARPPLCKNFGCVSIYDPWPDLCLMIQQ